MAAFEGTGLSKHIRSNAMSETYDLAGVGEAQAKDLVRDTFSQPIPSTEPLRITFLIGGGKTQNRQKYDGDLGRYLTAALREVGFREDRAATALMECQGSYKSQHDTHKGIRTLQVFPHVDLVEPEEGEGVVARGRMSRLSSPEYMAAVCTFDTFQEMVQEKVCSWNQKKRLARHLSSSITRHQEAEAKLTEMHMLSDEEQDVYDNIDPDVMEQKMTWLQSLIKGMVENGQLTKAEREQVLSQVQTKLETLSGEQEAATIKEDDKALAKIHKQAANLTARRSMVMGHTPISHRVKHQDELRGITAKLLKIEKLENTRGRLLTIDEVKQVGLKAELLERANILENDSRGWFEDDDELEARLKEVRKQGQRMASKVLGTKGGKSGAGAGSGKGSMAMDSDGWNKVRR